MRAVVQRVTSSKVSVDGKTVGEIGKGFNVLLGVVEDDTGENFFGEGLDVGAVGEPAGSFEQGR